MSVPTPQWGPWKMERPKHDGFVFKSWIKTLRRECPYMHMAYGDYQRGQKRVIEGLLARPNVECWLAVNAEHMEPYYGYICYEWREGTFVLHFVYVRKLYRQMGVATALMAFAGHGATKGLVATAHSKALSYHHKRWAIRYDFFAGWEAMTDGTETGHAADDVAGPSIAL